MKKITDVCLHANDSTGALALDERFQICEIRRPAKYKHYGISICLPPYYLLLSLSLSFEKVKTISVPLCYSATLYPSGKWLVTGGDDFKLYKFDYEEEKEVGELSKLLLLLSKLSVNFYYFSVNSVNFTAFQ